MGYKISDGDSISFSWSSVLASSQSFTFSTLKQPVKTLEELDLLYATDGRIGISIAMHSHKGVKIPKGSLALRRNSSAAASFDEKERTSGTAEAAHRANGVV